jgi:hypothetical protein
MDQLIKSLLNTIFRKGSFDNDVASGAKATKSLRRTLGGDAENGDRT